MNEPGAGTLLVDVAWTPALLHASGTDVVAVVDVLSAGTLACWALDAGHHQVHLQARELGTRDEHQPAAVAAARPSSDEKAGAVLPSTDLVDALDAVRSAAVSHPFVVGLCNARVASVRLAAAADAADRIVLVAAGDGGAVAVEDIACCGVMVRLLLQESTRALALTDAAGAAITVASSYPDPATAVSSGQVATRLRESSSAFADIVGMASALDAVAAVPVATSVEDAEAERRWLLAHGPVDPNAQEPSEPSR